MRKAIRKYHILYIYLSILLVFTTYILILKKSNDNFVVTVAKKNIITSLHEELKKNFTSLVSSECDYHRTLMQDASLSPSLVEETILFDGESDGGGEFVPEECAPKYSSAIIIPTRAQKAVELRLYLEYIHTFLRMQNIHYRIFAVEQNDELPYNRAKLINIGAVEAMKAGYPCLIIHDSNVVPLKLANLYACTKQPRQMISNTKMEFGNNFPFPRLIIHEGALSILSNQFKAVNGMSNNYFCYKGETNDFLKRLKAKGFKLYRFERDISKYEVLNVGAEINCVSRNKSLENTVLERMWRDGLNSLEYKKIDVTRFKYFTNILVDL